MGKNRTNNTFKNTFRSRRKQLQNKANTNNNGKKQNKQYVNDDFQQYPYKSIRKHPKGYLYPQLSNWFSYNI